MPFDAKITHNVYFCDNKFSKLRWYMTPITRSTKLKIHSQWSFQNQLHIAPLALRINIGYQNSLCKSRMQKTFSRQTTVVVKLLIKNRPPKSKSE